MDTADLTEVTIGQIIWWSVFISLAAWLAFLVYRAMDHPRLVLTATPAGPRATSRDTWLYIVSMPFLVSLWWIFFFAVFLINENNLNPVQLLVFPSALVVSIRALAFLSPHTAHELAKVIPIALVAFVILDGSIRDATEFEEVLDHVFELEVSPAVILFVLLIDYALTAIWYWGWIRWGRERWTTWRSKRSVQQIPHDDGRVAVLPHADGADGGA